MKRKRIALITINPENESVTYTMRGVFAQSHAYNYDVAVISPMVHSSHYFKDYRAGELGIYDVINFDQFDGVIITPVPMQEEQNTDITDRLLEKFKKECHIPVVALDSQFGDYDVVYCDETSGIHTITSHVVNQHGCKNIAVLTGPAEVNESVSRAMAVREYLTSVGLTLEDDRIVYGDFWYTSGEKLAADIISGAFDKPDAVICTSDHMAIGLVNALTNGGVKVPGDIVVVGYGGTMEAAMNYTPVTTYEYDKGHTGAVAVNRLMELMEPDRDIIPATIAGDENICRGISCGCRENTVKIRKALRNFMHTDDGHSYSDIDSRGISMLELQDSYISETFTSMRSVDACVKKIYESLYLLKPYGCFYLCLNSDWLDGNINENTYSKEMNLVIYSDMAKKLHGYANHVFWGDNGLKTFDRSVMVPVFDNKVAQMIPGLEDIDPDVDICDVPQVYYFTPIHFNEVSMGYAVLQHPLIDPIRTNGVYRNYIRYVNNALEMSRAKNIIQNMSEHDQLTGLYNRRGLERAFEDWRQDVSEELKKSPEKEYNILAMVIDMNNLKIINDTEGHEAGDVGINAIAMAARLTAKGREIVVRGGGDEFYILGIGEYTEEEGLQRAKAFRENLRRINDSMSNGAQYSAAVGYAVASFNDNQDYHAVLDEADVLMYVDKRASKRGRYV